MSQQRPPISRSSSSSGGVDPRLPLPPRPSSSSSRHSQTRKPVPPILPDLALEPQGIMNFHRRPSATYVVEPVTSRSRDLVAPMPSLPSVFGTTGGVRSAPAPRSPTFTNSTWPQPSQVPLHAPRSSPSPTQSPSPSPSPDHPRHQRKSSHTRQPSISLTPTSTNFPGQSNILPPHPVPTRTRAPLDSFASIEMLQGQRNVEEKRRGSEVWGSETGRYEGRAVAGIGANYSMRRVDPNEHIREARGSSRLPAVASLPPIDVDISSIAYQLRSHDNRRPSADDPTSASWRRGSVPSPEEVSPTSIMMPSVDYAFPPRPTISAPYVLDAISDDSSSDEDGYDLGDDKSYNHFSSSTEKLPVGSMASGKKPSGPHGWRTEILDGSSNDGSSVGGASVKHRPSIVALPVYPAPSGSLAKSWKFKKNLRKVGLGVSWFTLTISLGAMWVYLVARSEGMASVEARIPGRFWVGWVFLSVEFLIAVIVGIQAIYDVVTYRTSSGVPKLRLRGDKNLPAVDVFIICSGQQDSATFDCAIAAASMDYPAHRFRVMVIDPTGSADLERDILKHSKSQGCPHLTYHRHQLNASAGDVTHSKANSINFGMKEASTFGIKGPGEFIAVFDADVIPERNFLRAALPAVLSNSKVALVKTGHGFINLPAVLSQATSTLIEAAEPKFDSRSGFILRRTAITEIGGFPAESWLPDGHAEALFLGRGYKTAIVDEVLQWGMAKPTYGSQVNQMMINRLGPLRTAAKLNFFITGDSIKLMSTGARLKALGRALSPIFSLAVLLLTVAYPLMFTYGGLLVLTPNLASLNVLLQACLVMLVTASLHDLVWTWSTGLSSPRRKLQAWVFSAPYEGVALLRVLLPSWLGGYSRGGDIDFNAASEAVRPTIWKRIGWLIIDPHSDVIFAFAGSIGIAIFRAVRDYEHGTVDVHQTALTILLTVAWPSMVFVDLIYGSLVPYTCLLFPSHLLTEKRETFVIRDVYSSIARPKQNCKTARPFKVQRFPQFITAFILIGWSIAAVSIGLATKLFV
ncbi:hypothetical protein P7C70_g120, partial [Phenoliferia sp. Uapishka_3]